MLKDIPLRRLNDVAVMGNFTINCHDLKMYEWLLTFFYNPKVKTTIKFKDIPALKSYNEQIDRWRRRDGIVKSIPIIIKSYKGVRTVPPFKFIIKYKTLDELLKLREIFNVRASKFDTCLIDKRGYDPFTPDFFDRCADPTIYKVKK